ncbi:TPA: DegT/DnrJ/EryC1/StrS family aminotransferase [Citrobacter koseri]|uniref:DegT/DnrJ/EryC1/StrS family aminotransferase n=2 Tax=Citrobacter koseri TaxID=545 RepID=A0AAQ1A7E4_CITKO|nr:MULTISPECIES: DegT/DnrJ/EryC1/StrS family aminotransferase [Citrobacter]OFV13974.1 aminotransferase [Salmonella sp. HMSC13B08]ASE85510.1 DegT/DnrJ/EryC1/StrS family aminotransferase [Citrobacter koseri]ATF99970.1 DegT/DnrJ/EryC1/StrS family aminotransferase [Citrobacter koseri]AVE70816.1 DegT/DnrJ/EryC1/StrS family aminotransferase [Citrobacter koseri]EJK7980155.1 DegT/DnrJ/EryC1/StrS family aminotransferase [Citrobacter koseri]
MDKNIFVTSPLLPPLDEFIPYLEEIWQNKQLTNAGPFHQQLEEALAEYLGVEHLCLFANGTLALLTAFQALRITGEVITTPYSFVATSHSLLWNGLKPVFVDIDPVTCNMDPRKIEEAITPQTTAILPVHCYGIPCDTTHIQQIADIYGLKVIYDAAHAFGVKREGTTILREGDLSVLSFHATKVFNTIEGGAIICHDKKTKQRIDYLKNFGFAGETTIVAPGINGKMNEVQSAFGLLQLRHIDKALAERAALFDNYKTLLADIPGISLLIPPDNIAWNHAYCPIMVSDAFPVSRDGVYDLLKSHNIMPRRYFYPLISSFPMYRALESARQDKLKIAQLRADEVLCLPLYPGLEKEVQVEIASLLKGVSENVSSDSSALKTDEIFAERVA